MSSQPKYGLTPEQKQQITQEVEAKPDWTELLPYCSEECPQYDGKRCMLTGFRPYRICDPVIEEVILSLAISLQPKNSETPVNETPAETMETGGARYWLE